METWTGSNTDLVRTRGKGRPIEHKYEILNRIYGGEDPSERTP